MTKHDPHIFGRHIADIYNVPPHAIGIGRQHRWTWRLRRTWRRKVVTRVTTRKPARTQGS